MNLEKILLEIKLRSHNPFFIDKGNPENTVILSGVGRGGTTWISEIINYDNEFRYIFEPLNADRVPLFYNFKRRQYINANNNEFDNQLNNLLSGKIKHYWTDHYNKKIISHKRLIKFVRGNLILGRIRNLHPKIPIVLLIRHPFSSAGSQVTRNWIADFDQLYLNQPNLIDDFLTPYIDYLKSLDSHFEKQIAMWCVDTLIPLKQFNNEDIHVCFYENFVQNPENEIKKLYNYIRKTYSNDVLKLSKKPSKISSKDSTVKNYNQNQLTTARIKNLGQKEIEKGIDVLKKFNLDKVYDLKTNLPNEINLDDF